MNWQAKAIIVARLQSACSIVFNKVINDLQTGMNETAIANLVRANLQTLGITKFWYDVPIFVLLGAERFQTMASTDYSLKSPTKNSKLTVGCPVYIGYNPMDTETNLWGD